MVPAPAAVRFACAEVLAPLPMRREADAPVALGAFEAAPEERAEERFERELAGALAAGARVDADAGHLSGGGAGATETDLEPDERAVSGGRTLDVTALDATRTTPLPRFSVLAVVAFFVASRALAGPAELAEAAAACMLSTAWCTCSGVALSVSALAGFCT